MAAIHTVAFDFDGVFTDNRVWVDQDGRESVACDRRDGLAFDLVRVFQARGVFNAELFILSKETNPVVLARARKMRLTCYHGIGDKLTFMREHLARRSSTGADSLAGVIYLGNDLNDLPLMRYVGYSVAPADAHPMVRRIAHRVLDEPGGSACVRAFIESLLGINNLTDEEIDELVSDR
jgi:N-acylneuraminate cytidylyltransferase